MAHCQTRRVRAVTVGMSADGVYDRHSDYQMAGGKSHLELVSSAAQRLAQDLSGESFFIADYGSAQGRTSDPLIAEATRQVRDERPDIPIFVCHNDVVTNDWKTLFDRLAQPDSYPAKTSGPIIPMTSATSFYQPVTPPGVINLGLSFAAIQWLRHHELPGSGDALYFDQLDSEMLESLSQRARSDWARFLRLRGEELAPGGMMILDMMGVDSEGAAAGSKAWAHLSSIAAGMAREGRISSELLDGYVFPVYERSMEELLEPFEDGDIHPLHVEHAELVPVPNPLAHRYDEDNDAGRFARDSVDFVRAFSEPSLRSGLALSDETADELFSELRDRIEAEPDRFAFNVHVLTAVIVRAS